MQVYSNRVAMLFQLRLSRLPTCVNWVVSVETKYIGESLNKQHTMCSLFCLSCPYCAYYDLGIIPNITKCSCHFCCDDLCILYTEYLGNYKCMSFALISINFSSSISTSRVCLNVKIAIYSVSVNSYVHTNLNSENLVVATLQ